MPIASLQILTNNNLIIKFNDTITKINPTDEDLYIVIYGPLTSYEFTWTASFQDSSTLIVKMVINSEITGQGEKVYVEFPYSNNLRSIYSLRQSSPEISLNGFLNAENNSKGVNIFGQTTMFIFLGSALISVLSSFGGNSMELMWIFTNYLQLIYYISAVNVSLPDILDVYFPYVQVWNSNNPYLSKLSYLIIPESKFTRGDVSKTIGAKAFFVSASDKLPWLLPVIILFLLIKLTDYWENRSQNKWISWIRELILLTKYNFFLRMCIELELDIGFNAIINIYFVSFSF